MMLLYCLVRGDVASPFWMTDLAGSITEIGHLEADLLPLLSQIIEDALITLPRSVTVLLLIFKE